MTPPAAARARVSGAPEPAVEPSGEAVRGRLLTRGHDRAVAAVRTMIAGRVPHAILISGAAGIGKTTLALDLAAGLLCDDPEPAARPCRDCRGCRLVTRGRHPDVHRLAPSGPGDQIRIGRRDAPEDGTVRRLAADLVLLPVEGAARLAIIERADRLTDDAQTALLKTLEEPPAGVTIVLCADDEDRLLPTVRSRAARIRLGPVATREIEGILADADAAEPPLAARLARLSGGRPGLARLLARAPDALAARDEIGRSLLDLLGSTAAPRLAAARDLTTRATELIRALDRASREDGPDSEPGGGGPAGGGRGASRAKSRARPVSVADVATTADAAGTDDAGEDADLEPDDAGARRIAVPAAERRRAAIVLVGVWRDLTRDLLVTVVAEDRQVRDTALLDDLRAAAAQFPASPDGGGDSVPTGSALGAFLGRLDAAGELLEANVRPELILDSLLLAWPTTTRPPDG